MIGSVNSFTGNIKGGVTVSSIPASISGFYKVAGMATGDTIGISGYTTKNGNMTSFGIATYNSNKASWTSFSLPLPPFTTNDADTLYFYATSGKISPSGINNSLGILFDLDNLTIPVTVTGIDNRSLGSEFLVFPNPASESLTVVSKNDHAKVVTISGVDGHLVKKVDVESESTVITTGDLSAGVYFYSVLDAKGKTLLMGKVLVQD
jgi:hypothetical protein